MLLFNMFLFAIWIAFVCAKFEINIEGKYGWAENLPTWKVKNRFTKLFWGEEPLTGYHAWFNVLVFTFVHFPYVVGIPLSLRTECQILAMTFFGIVVEDIFWFALNPHFGLKKLNKEGAPWHNGWVGPIPGLYTRLSIAIVGLLILSFIV